MSVPTLVISPQIAPMLCACCGVAPAAMSFVVTTVGAQKLDDHRPKMMQVIISAADQVTRACAPWNSVRNFGAVTCGRRRRGSGMRVRK